MGSGGRGLLVGRRGPVRSSPPSPLCDQLTALCTEAVRRLGPGAERDAVAAVRDRLTERILRVAVGGRLNAGKSTLVNALLGQRLAATGSTECTMVVAWFRDHHQNRVLVRPVRGEPYYVPPAPGGAIPRDLRPPGERSQPLPKGEGAQQIAREQAAQIESVTVEVANARLASNHVIVDTPGLDSLTGLDDRSLAALREADALLYVMPHPGENDVEALEALRVGASDTGFTAVNVLGVLSRVDQLGEGTGDPWDTARRIASRYADELTGLVATVLPVAGLLAETALGDVFTEADTQLIVRLAGVDRDQVEDALYSADDFRGFTDGPLDLPQRERLLGLLGVYGLWVALGLVDGGARTTAAMLAGLRDQSGIDGLLEYVGQQFVLAADRLRATTALAALEEASWLGSSADSRSVLEGLRAELDGIRRHPAMRQAGLIPALRDLGSGRLALGEDDSAALVALATGQDDAARFRLPSGAPTATVLAEVQRWVTRWRVLEAAPSRVVARHARLARELCETTYFALR